MNARPVACDIYFSPLPLLARSLRSGRGFFVFVFPFRAVVVYVCYSFCVSVMWRALSCPVCCRGFVWGTASTTTSTTPAPCPGFTCSDGTCLMDALLQCDGRADCPDATDETGCPQPTGIACWPHCAAKENSTVGMIGVLCVGFRLHETTSRLHGRPALVCPSRLTGLA